MEEPLEAVEVGALLGGQNGEGAQDLGAAPFDEGKALGGDAE